MKGVKDLSQAGRYKMNSDTKLNALLTLPEYNNENCLKTKCQAAVYCEIVKQSQISSLKGTYQYRVDEMILNSSVVI